MIDKNLLDIRQAAKFIGVSIDTLRRWDHAGKLIAIRSGGKGSHRFYQKSVLELFLKNPFTLAKSWAFSQVPFEPEKDSYCTNSYIFQARLVRLESGLQKTPDIAPIAFLITSITGEIGNNSFDHNLGSWPDINGIFFAYDINKRMVALADRGHGILQTLQKVRPALKNHIDALEVAFTEIVTGRAPEKRGNGLKYVRSVIAQSPINLLFQSGDAQLKLKAYSDKLHLQKTDNNFHGCFALIKF